MENEKSLLQEIYILNKVLRKYRVNFYYSIKKDGIFILHGWIAKDRLNVAYGLSAIGSILFAFSFFYHQALLETPSLYFGMKIISIISLLCGLFILYDFYSKLKNLKTTSLVTRSGISFRDNSEIEFWPIEKIKNIEAVNTVSKKRAMKTVQEEIKLKREGKLILFNQMGQSKEIVSISHKNREEVKADLESVKAIVEQFMNLTKEEKRPVNDRSTSVSV